MIHDHTVSLCGKRIDRPGHICAFFDSREQEYETLIPYFLDGLDSGEQVFNILDSSRYDDHVRRLSAAGLDPSDDRITIRTSEETYLENGRFDMDKMCEVVTGQLVAAREQGKRVRTAGVMDWLTRNAPGSERAIEYEARMNLLVPAFDCTFMCVYDLSKLDGKTVVDILATHHFTIFKGQIRQNPFFIEPDIYLRQLLEEIPDHDRWV